MEEVEDRRKLLEKLKEKMLSDEKLPLKKWAKKLVFGEGDPYTWIMFIGEGPGFWEDKLGRPFVGNAGAFLNQLIAVAGLKRESVFITNVVHHRPPQNRDPEPYEIEAYKPYLDEMIRIIRPKLIVTLGRFSMAKFLPKIKISSSHGKKFKVEWEGFSFWVVPMYHPAAGLRSEDVKRKTIADFERLSSYLQEIKKEFFKEEKKGEQIPLL